MEYSFKKGLLKGLQSALVVAITVVGVTAFADVDVWSLLEQYLKPYLSGVTIVGGLTMLLNYIKVKNN